MGCTASSTSAAQYNSRQNYNQRPQANVQPMTRHQPTTQTQQHQQVPMHQQQPVTKDHKNAQQASLKPTTGTVVYNTKKTEIVVKKINTTKDLLQKYIDLENEVRQLEARNSDRRVEGEQHGLAVMDADIARLEAAYKEAQKRTALEKKDIDDFYTMWQDAVISDDAELILDKEKREYLEARAAEDVALQELNEMKKKKGYVQQMMGNDLSISDLLQQKYREQEELLAAIFKGNYGSDAENKLESEYDYLMDRQQRVSAARYKWTNGRNLLQYATSQLCLACKKWMELRDVDYRDQKKRYVLATETRNNVIAAAQNITGAQRYLSTIDFPYCKPAEVAVLEKAAGHVYTDMLNPERHQYVYANTFLSMYKRCKALVEWFTYVLDETIRKDYKEAAIAVNKVSLQLRHERLTLIAQKIKEELNQDFHFDLKETEANMFMISEDTMSLSADDNQVFKPEKIVGGEGAADGKQPAKPGNNADGEGANNNMELTKPLHIVGGDGAQHDQPDGTTGTEDTSGGQTGGTGEGGQGDASGGTGTTIVAGNAGGESNEKENVVEDHEEPPEGDIAADKPFNPVPLKDLVQAPKKEDLFGDAQELYRKHQEDLEELERNQLYNKTRQEQGLEEKLRARRSRRQRQAAIDAELTVENTEPVEDEKPEAKAQDAEA